jgi:hypothetical protein
VSAFLDAVDLASLDERLCGERTGQQRAQALGVDPDEFCSYLEAQIESQLDKLAIDVPDDVLLVLVDALMTGVAVGTQYGRLTAGTVPTL